MSRVVLVLLVAAVAVAVVPTPSLWVEQLYSQQVYLIFQRGVTSLSSLVGFSLLDHLGQLFSSFVESGSLILQLMIMTKTVGCELST